MTLKGKTVIVGVTGGIAAYKSCDLVSKLKAEGCDVFVIMTKNAAEFVRPLTFETLSGNETVIDTFERKGKFDVEHVSLAKKADLFIVAPATANFIGKIASGISDDMLTTTFTACSAPKIVCPAMNVQMYENLIVQENIKKLKSFDIKFIEPQEGRLACGDIGKGRLPETALIISEIKKLFISDLDFLNKRVLITAGATMEYIDAVRYISNFSSGKMGIEIAKAFKSRGANVTLVLGKVSEKVPENIDKVINVISTDDMYDVVLREISDNDIIIKAAAPADYKPINFTPEKIKEKSLTLNLCKNKDIAAACGKVKGNKKLIIFSAETENLEKNAKEKLQKKNADMVIANDVTKEGAGFNVDTNIVTIFTKEKKFNFDKMLKSDLAQKIADLIKSELI